MAAEIKLKPGLYIHIPFCIKKCPYCDFYSTADSRLIPAWLDAVKREILLYREYSSSFSTLYFGGGTPTVINEHAMRELVGFLHENFTFLPGAEKTIEANPNDLSRENLKMLRDLGFNRISLGVQSFDRELLEFLERRHTVYEAEQAIELIREAGFSNLNIDIMYAIPGQTRDKWISTLSRAVSFKPEHVSCYQLTLKEGTPFWNLRKNSTICMPEETDEEAFFLETAKFLKHRGYLHYEVSNFARDMKYVSVHNSLYWKHHPYLGLGPAAHSFFNNTRWWNCKSVKQYLKSFEDGNTPVEGREELTDDQLRLESLFLNFRTTGGMDIESFQTFKRVGTVLPILEKSNLVKIKDGRVVPTTKGLLVADSIPCLFL